MNVIVVFLYSIQLDFMSTACFAVDPCFQTMQSSLVYYSDWLKIVLLKTSLRLRCRVYLKYTRGPVALIWKENLNW